MRMRKVLMNWLKFSLIASGLCMLCMAENRNTPPKIYETQDAIYVDIDVPGALATYPQGISPNGRIVGLYVMEKQPNSFLPIYVNGTGFLLEGNRFTDIVYPGMPPSAPIHQTAPLKINASGDIVGWRAIDVQPAPSELGWVARRGHFTAISYEGPVPPDSQDPIYSKITDVMSINSSGDMAGQLGFLHPASPWPPLSHWHGWFYTRGCFQYIDPPRSVMTAPYDINDKGEIVGYYVQDDWASGATLGFLRDRGGSYYDIAVPDGWGAWATIAVVINSEGVIVGLYILDGLPHGFLLKNGQFAKIDHPAAVDSVPWGINPSGEIVGAYTAADGIVHGYLRIPKHPFAP